MKSRQYIEPLARHKRIAAIVCVVTGAPLLVLGVALLDSNSVPAAIVRGFGITFLAVGLLELIPEAVRFIIERRKRVEFTQFFGRNAIRSGVSLVNSGRTIDTKHLQYLVPDPQPPDSKDAVPEGVRWWMADQDIRACSYLSQLFGAQGVPVDLTTSRKVNEKKLDYSSISIGLGFNQHTRRLAEQYGGKLFNVSFGKSPFRENITCTDHIEIGERTIPAPLAGNDWVLIARIVASKSRGVIHFVAAGRTAHGTAVAGHFLANSWEKIVDLYRRHNRYLDADSVALLITHPSPRYEEDGDDRGVIDENYVVFLPGIDAST